MKLLNESEVSLLLKILKARFEKNMYLHGDLSWEDVEKRLIANPEALWSINEMELTYGEPDLVILGDMDEMYYYDTVSESPKGRRSLCYDDEALNSRKENKPKGSAIGVANEMGVEILDESEYRTLQELFSFDLKTSSWTKTPEKIRELGGSIFCDRRFDTVFTYHNGAESYYSSRGFRGKVKI